MARIAKTLWDKNRFSIWKREKKLFLKKLTFKKSAEILEALTSPDAFRPFKTTVFSDKPVCLKFGLRKKRHEVAS